MSNYVIDMSANLKQKAEICYGEGVGDPPWIHRLVEKDLGILF